MVEFLLVMTFLVVFPALLFGLFQVATPQPAFRAGVAARIGPYQYKLLQLIVAVVLCALVFSTGAVAAPAFPLTLAGLILIYLFLRAWQSEFVFLMGLRDDDFPGRFDKLIWVIVLLAFAPIGSWFFRSYRLAHWPEPVTPPRFDLASPGTTTSEPA